MALTRAQVKERFAEMLLSERTKRGHGDPRNFPQPKMADRFRRMSKTREVLLKYFRSTSRTRENIVLLSEASLLIFLAAGACALVAYHDRSNVSGVKLLQVGWGLNLTLAASVSLGLAAIAVHANHKGKG